MIRDYFFEKERYRLVIHYLEEIEIGSKYEYLEVR